MWHAHPPDDPSYGSGRSAVARALRGFLASWLASSCLGCRRPLPWGAQPLGLCAACLVPTRRPRPPCCAACGSPIADPRPPAGFRCGRCRRRPPPWRALHWGWSYAAPLDAVLRAAKFGRLPFLAEDLGAALGVRLAAELPAVDLVVPVPLPAWRRLQRGFNQAAAIAVPLAAAVERPLVAGLASGGFASPQARRRRRARAGRRRFHWRGEGLRRQRVLLVDDVKTTGATLADACRVLLEAGAASVDAAVALRTPEPGEE